MLYSNTFTGIFHHMKQLAPDTRDIVINLTCLPPVTHEQAEPITAELTAPVYVQGRCPLTTLAENQGAKKGSVTDIFLPDFIARNIFRVSFPFFILELILLAVRFFTGI